MLDKDFVLCGTSTESLVFRAPNRSSLVVTSSVFFPAFLALVAVFETLFLRGVLFAEVFAALAGLLRLPVSFFAVGEGLLTELLVDLGAAAAKSEDRLDLLGNELCSTSCFCFLSEVVAGSDEASKSTLRLDRAISVTR